MVPIFRWSVQRSIFMYPLQPLQSRADWVGKNKKELGNLLSMHDARFSCGNHLLAYKMLVQVCDDFLENSIRNVFRCIYYDF